MRYGALFVWRDPDNTRKPVELVDLLTSRGMHGARVPTDELRILLLQFRSYPRNTRLKLVANYQASLGADPEPPLPLKLETPTVVPRDPPLLLAMARPRPPRPSIQPELKPRPKPKPAPIPPPKPSPAPPAPPPRPRVPRPSKRPPRAQEAPTPLLREALPVTEVAQLKPKKTKRPPRAAQHGPVVKRGKFCHWCLDIADNRPINGTCEGCKRPYQREEFHAEAKHSGYAISDLAGF